MRSPDRSENLGSLNLERWEPFEQRVGVGRWGDRDGVGTWSALARKTATHLRGTLAPGLHHH